MKTCRFELPSNSLCGAPALKSSPAGLCRFHARDQKRQTVMTQARAEKPLLTTRRSLRAAHDLRIRRLRSIYIPMLLDYPSLTIALDNVLRAYDTGIMDHRTTRAMLGALRIASTAVRSIAVERGATKASVKRVGKDFEVRVVQALELLRLDRKAELLHRMLKNQTLPGFLPRSVP